MLLLLIALGFYVLALCFAAVAYVNRDEARLLLGFMAGVWACIGLFALCLGIVLFGFYTVYGTAAAVSVMIKGNILFAWYQHRHSSRRPKARS